MDQHPAVKSARMECGRELGSFLPGQATPRLSPEGERESAEGMKGGPVRQTPGRFSSTPVPYGGFIKLFFFSYSAVPQCLSALFPAGLTDNGRGVHILTRSFTF